MASVTRTHTYPEGKPARASHCNYNEIILYNLVNGNIDWENIKAALVNAAGGLLKLDAGGKVPLAVIPTPLTGKYLENPYEDTLNLGATRELQHNSITIVNTDGKVLHAVYM